MYRKQQQPALSPKKVGHSYESHWGHDERRNGSNFPLKHRFLRGEKSWGLFVLSFKGCSSLQLVDVKVQSWNPIPIYIEWHILPIYIYPNKKKAAAKNKNPAKWRNPYIFNDHGAYMGFAGLSPQKTPRKRASSCCNSPFTLKRPSPEADRAAEGGSCYMSSVAVANTTHAVHPGKWRGGGT